MARSWQLPGVYHSSRNPSLVTEKLVVCTNQEEESLWGCWSYTCSIRRGRSVQVDMPTPSWHSRYGFGRLSRRGVLRGSRGLRSGHQFQRLGKGTWPCKESELATREREEPGSSVSSNSTEKTVSIKNTAHSVNSDMRTGGNWEQEGA